MRTTDATNESRERPARPAWFIDRTEVGERLARKLEAHRGTGTRVVGVPRGGAIVGEAIARYLECELDVVLAYKLHAPWRPEVTVGAIAESDVQLWSERARGAEHVTARDRQREIQRAHRDLARALDTYRRILPRTSLEDSSVILADDGAVTGTTLRAAILALSRRGAASITVAVPGGPSPVMHEIAQLPIVSEVVTLLEPEALYVVDQLYPDYVQVSLRAVCDVLRRERNRRAALLTALR